MDTSKILELAPKVTLTAALMAVVWGHIQGVWVSGTIYQQVIVERDQWKNLALRGTNLAQDISNIIPRAGLPNFENDHVTTKSTINEVANRINSLSNNMLPAE